jgi:hypothetical protein
MLARRRAYGGRPPKFDEPRRPVTVTLPERTLVELAMVDDDRAAAIVKLVDSRVQSPESSTELVKVVKVAPQAAIILVPPSHCLRRIPWLRLAGVSPGRYLLTIAPGTTIESLEVTLLDLLEGLPSIEDHERAILEELLRLIRSSRRLRTISKFEMLYIKPPAKRRRARSKQ